MSDILTKIIEHKKEEVAKRKRRGLFYKPFWNRRQISLKERILLPGFHIIAEIKRASPSKGLIAKDFDPVKIAKKYEKGGASAISVLTDEKFFMGHLEYLAAIRSVVSLPILRKDFIIDEIQLEEARAFGADAVLLIVAALEPSQLKNLIDTARSLGLEALVEVHNEIELEIALSSGAELIGVNNRNLKTFEVDINLSIRLKNLVPLDIPMVAESGIKDIKDIERLKNAGIKAALIGESLIRSDDPASELREWLKI